MNTPEAIQDVSGSTSSKRILAFLSFFAAVGFAATHNETAQFFLYASCAYAGLTLAEWKMGGGSR